MTALWTSDEIVAATGGRASASFQVSGVTFDSREVTKGDLFIALKGEATDGHRYVDQAFTQGAAGAITSEVVAGPHVRVPETMAALESLGRVARQRTKAKIVGVTGSVGKTGTKEALRQALQRTVPDAVHASVKSYNNHTGVPLSLSRMPRETRFGVFEMGMNHSGELAALTRLVRPHVAIVTAIASAHRAFFDSEEAIARAKAEIFEGLEPGGVAIIPFDSPHYALLREAASTHAGRVVSFGNGVGADVRGLQAAQIQTGTHLVASLPGERTVTFTVAHPGAHWVSNALAVIAAVDALGADIAAAGLALGDLAPMAGRGARHVVAVAGGSATLIDESYNANPASMAAALATLGQTAAKGKRIAVLGAMRELGAVSDEMHAALAEPLIASGAEHALLVGEEMQPLAKALGGRVEVMQLPDASSAETALRALAADGDVILIKGSNALGLARLVGAFERGFV